VVRHLSNTWPDPQPLRLEKMARPDRITGRLALALRYIDVRSRHCGARRLPQVLSIDGEKSRQLAYAGPTSCSIPNILAAGWQHNACPTDVRGAIGHLTAVLYREVVRGARAQRVTDLI